MSNWPSDSNIRAFLLRSGAGIAHVIERNYEANSILAVTTIEHPPDQLALLYKQMVARRDQHHGLRQIPEQSLVLVGREQWVEAFGPTAGSEVADYFAGGGRDTSIHALLMFVLYQQCYQGIRLVWHPKVGVLDFTAKDLAKPARFDEVQARLQCMSWHQANDRFNRRAAMLPFQSSMDIRLL